MNYYSILTTAGLNKLISAATNNSQIVLSQMGVSDYSGEINQNLAALSSEKHKFSINTVSQSETDANVLICEGVIASEIGGFYIRKVGVYTDDGVLFAVGVVPESYKPLLAEGSAKDITIKFYMQVDNAANITLKVDNNVVLATRTHVQNEINKLNKSLEDKFLPIEGTAKDSLKLGGINASEYALKSQLQQGEFEPYNKAFIDEIKITGIKDISLDPNPFKDGSGEALYNFTDGGKSLSGKHHSTAQLVTVSGGKFGNALAGKQNAGKPLGIDIDLSSSWTVSFWVNDRGIDTDRIVMLFHNGNNYVSRQIYHRSYVSGEPIKFHTYGSEKWTPADNEQLNSSGTWWIKSPVPKTADSNWYHVVTTYDGDKITCYQDGVKLGAVIVGSGLRLYSGSNNMWLHSNLGNIEEGVLSQVRIFNRVLNANEVLTIYKEYTEVSDSKNTLVADATLFLCQGKNENNLYKNKVVALNAVLSDVSGLSDGEYYIKAKQDNTIKLVKERPSIGAKSSVSEYYVDGEWYGKDSIKLQPQTYLPYKVTISSNKMTSISPINLYPSDTGLGVNQEWQDMTSQRQPGIIYTNTTSRAIMAFYCFTTQGFLKEGIEVNGVLISRSNNTGQNSESEISVIVPPGAAYKYTTPQYPNSVKIFELR